MSKVVRQVYVILEELGEPGLQFWGPFKKFDRAQLFARRLMARVEEQVGPGETWRYQTQIEVMYSPQELDQHWPEEVVHPG